MRSSRAIVLAAAFLVAAGSRLDGQTVTGVVRDSLTAEALAGATVELYSVEGTLAARDITGQDGLFSLTAPKPGRFRIRFQRIGYRNTFSAAFALSDQDTSFSFRMLPAALPVTGVTVTASTKSYLENVGFNERRKSESGVFLDPVEVDKRSTRARQTGDLLDGIPGVTLLVAGGSWGVRVPVLTRQMGCEAGPRIYLDGHQVNPPGTIFDVNTVNAVELAAIEIYDSVSEIPLRFGGTDATCGVLVMWTKH